jgi:hypothetical protein
LRFIIHDVNFLREAYATACQFYGTKLLMRAKYIKSSSGDIKTIPLTALIKSSKLELSFTMSRLYLVISCNRTVVRHESSPY